MTSSDQDTNGDIFNAATKEDDDDIFSSATVATPHKVQLHYSLDLDSILVEKFPSDPVTKSVSESFTIGRKADADVELRDKYFPRKFIHVRFGSYQNGECLMTIKNMSSKKPIELKPPGAAKITLGCNKEVGVKSNTKITAVKLIWMITIEAGDMDATMYEVSMKGHCSEEFNQMAQAVEDLSSDRVHGEAVVRTPNTQTGSSTNNRNQVNPYRPQTEQCGRRIRNYTEQPLSSMSNGPEANVRHQYFTGNQWPARRHFTPLTADHNVTPQAQYQALPPFVDQGGVPPEFYPLCTGRSFNLGFRDAQSPESPLQNSPHFDGVSNYGQPYPGRYPSHQPHVSHIHDGQHCQGIPNFGQPYPGQYPSCQPPVTQVHTGPQYHGILNYGKPYFEVYPSSQPRAFPPNNGSSPGQYRPDFAAAQVEYPGQSGTGSYDKQPTTNWHAVKPTGIDEAVNLSPDHIRQHYVNTNPIPESSPRDSNPYVVSGYMQKKP
ncbi:hypothetical protein SNE40_017669 [Patella caerulea]|uniref:Uncharacterized protein n=1 Tax=Patella caerulea TaxID=87958 RepID=A0AAN8JEN2_PATCE